MDTEDTGGCGRLGLGLGRGLQSGIYGLGWDLRCFLLSDLGVADVLALAVLVTTSDLVGFFWVTFVTTVADFLALSSAVIFGKPQKNASARRSSTSEGPSNSPLDSCLAGAVFLAAFFAK